MSVKTKQLKRLTRSLDWVPHKPSMVCACFPERSLGQQCLTWQRFTASLQNAPWPTGTGPRTVMEKLSGTHVSLIQTNPSSPKIFNPTCCPGPAQRAPGEERNMKAPSAKLQAATFCRASLCPIDTSNKHLRQFVILTRDNR